MFNGYHLLYVFVYLTSINKHLRAFPFSEQAKWFTKRAAKRQLLLNTVNYKPTM